MRYAAMRYAAVILAGYLIGSVSASVLITRVLFHDDVRSHGSGNAGATNVARTFGWGPGLLTFFCDFAKCAAAVALGWALCGDWGFCLGGMACLIGHCFPVYFGFRGGKAVSTGACVAFLIDYRLGLVLFLTFAVIAGLSKTVSLASVSASAILTVLSAVFLQETPYRLLGVFTGLLVIFMHRANIRRLLKGTEPKFHVGHRDREGTAQPETPQSVQPDGPKQGG